MLPLRRTHNNDLPDQSDSSLAALKRRDFLLLSGAAIASLLSGCGGGGGTSSSAATLPGRTQPTGDLKNQINQYSLSADRLSSIWQAQSANVNSMVSFTAGRATRADAGWPLYVQATYVGLLGLQTVYEMFARQFVEFDNIGYLGEQVTARNSLQGTNALTNPQWLLAMMERGQVSISTFGYVLEVLQTNGLGELLETVSELTDPTEQLVFYGVTAEIFNGLVTKVAARVQYPLDPTWLLDVGNNAPVTNAVALAELNRVVPILNQLPFGPGYHTTVTLRDTILDPKDALPSVIGEILENIKETLANPKEVKDILITIETDIESYANRIDLDTTALSKFVLKNIGKELAKDVIKKAIGAGFTKWQGKLVGVIAECIIEVIDKSIDLAKYLSGTVASVELPPLAIAFATLSLLQVQSLIQKIIDCLMMIQKELPGRPPPVLLTGIITITEPPPPVRIPYVVNPLTAETDQIKRTKLLRGGVTVRRRRSSPPPIGLRALQGRLNADGSITTVSGTLTDQSTQVNVLDPDTGNVIATSPTRSASRAPSGNVLARSYEGVEIGAILLMLDLIDRNAAAFNPQDDADGNGVTYDRTDFALLLRRDPGTTETTVPAITSA